MAGRCGTAPPGAGCPVRGQAGGGAGGVVVVGLTFFGAASCVGEDEQALRRSPVSPAVASTPQANGCRSLARSVSVLAIAGRRSYGGQAQKWCHPTSRRPRDRSPARVGRVRRRECRRPFPP